MKLCKDRKIRFAKSVLPAATAAWYDLHRSLDWFILTLPVVNDITDLATRYIKLHRKLFHITAKS